MRVLVLIPGPLGDRMSAPEVRGWNLARELRRHHEVRIAAPASQPGVREGISIVELQRAEVLRAARQADAVIGAPIPPYLYASLARRPTVLVADLYNPIEAELAEAGVDLTSRLRVSAIRANEALQIKFADIILCAVDAQRQRLQADLAAAHSPRGRQPVLRVVPFGIDNEPPPATTRQPIRDRFPQIGPDDPVVLWWGNVWKWFDADTALRAFAEVVRDIPKAKLVFTGGKPPRQEASELDRTDTARAMAERLGLLGTSVYFLDEWIEHAVRHEYLQEADVGLTLHRDTPEKEVAARGRYMDYLWARLPCVLGAGDELADRFARQGFARVVRTGDVSQAAHELRRLIEDPSARSAAGEAADALVDAFRWSAAVSPLINALTEVRGTPRLRRAAASRLALGLGRAYSLRVAWEGAKVLEKRQGAGVSDTTS